MAKGKARASGDRPAEAEVDLQETIAGASASGEAAQGAQAQTAAQLLQALHQSQADMKRAYDQVLSSLSENVSKMSSVSEDIAKKQDLNVDEAMAGAQGILANDQVALSRIVNNAYANHANIASTRSQTHFDSLQTILQMHLASIQFQQSMAHSLLVADTHQQCAKNADWRASTVPQVMRPAK